MPDALSLSRSELPEEIATAIEKFTTAATHCGIAIGTPRFGQHAEHLQRLRLTLDAAILSRLGEAEAANGRISVENIHLAARYVTADQALVAALARVEMLEKALKPFAKMAEPVLTEKPSWATPEAYAFRIHPGAVAVTFGDFFRAHDALSEAPPQGEQ